MKKALLIGGGIVAALAVAGALLGPKLYERVRGPATPLGRVREVKPIAAFGAPNDPSKIPPSPGMQFWVVKIDAQSGVRGSSGGETAADLAERTQMIDDAGNRHTLWKATYSAEWTGQEFKVTTFELVFSLPVYRQPRSLQVGDTPPVDLP